MSSDDPSFYEKEFAGDETGHIFIAPDTVPESLVPTERTVETQSGFIVSVKNIDGRISLSVKRSVGTPPTSSVVFTPDESLKLSKILALSSNDELAGMASYYAASNSRLNARAVRDSKVRNLVRSLPTSRLSPIWSFLFLLAAVAFGYYAHPLLRSWLGAH